MTQVQYTVEPQGRPLAVMVSIATLEQLIESLETCSPGDYSTGYVIHPSFDAKAVDAAITAGRAALANAEQQVPQWLPIETAPQNEKVLLACDGGIVIGMWRHYRIHNAPKFTHWMPLPTPPKEAL